MALPTFLTGMLPDYSRIGLAAPIILVLLRMMQGLSVGGEYTTSIVYLVERCRSHHRGVMASCSVFGANMGVMLGSATGAILAWLLPRQELIAWGWRGSTAIAEHMEPSAYAALLNRFYRVATEVLVRYDAIVDKLIGDEVMALFIPGICGADYKRLAAEAAVALLNAVGYRAGAKVWLPIGAAVNSGLRYVGNVGGEGKVDFTALGDTVNTASRLASVAAAGEVLLSQGVFATVADEFPFTGEPNDAAARPRDPVFCTSLAQAGRYCSVELVSCPAISLHNSCLQFRASFPVKERCPCELEGPRRN